MNETNGKPDDERPPWYGTAEGRGDRGLFAPGNQLSKGHAGPRRATALRQRFRQRMTDEALDELFDSLLESAKEGDVSAARTLLDHAMGRAVQGIEVSGPEGRSLDVTTVAAIVMEAIGEDQQARIRVAAAFARLGRQQQAEESGDVMGE